MENSAYMESVAGDRAVLAYDHDEEAALDGAQLIRRAADRGTDAADTAGRGRGGSEPDHAA
jgi:hypothetical protein